MKQSTAVRWKLQHILKAEILKLEILTFPKITIKKKKTCPQICQRSFRRTFTAVNPLYAISPIRIRRKELILARTVLNFLSCKLNEAYQSHKQLCAAKPKNTWFPMQWTQQLFWHRQCWYYKTAEIHHSTLHPHVAFIHLLHVLVCVQGQNLSSST